MRLPKILVIAGLIFIAIGAIVALVPITQEVWEPKSKVLVDKATTVYAGAEHTWPLTYLFLRPENVRDLVVRGYVEEKKGRPFDLKIENGKVYVEATNVSGRHEFEFSPTPEELEEGLKLRVLNNRATIEVVEDFIVETLTVYSFSDSSYLLRAPLLKPPKSVPVEITGTAEGARGYSFNLYVLDERNYERWEAKVPFEAYYEGRNASSYEFTFTVPAEKCTKYVYFVVERLPVIELKKETLIDETLTIYRWMKYSYWFVRPLYKSPAKNGIVVKGTAEEAKGHLFNLYFLDETNFERYKAGLTYKSYWEGKRRSSYKFEFTIPLEKATEYLYYVVERVMPGVKLNVYISATKSWYEDIRPRLSVMIDTKKSYTKPIDITVRYHVEASWEERTYAHVLAGLFAGAILVGLGFILLIASAIAKYVFKR
ncbi:MAG: hypothetical protein DRJ59_07425 [Thermoprotei archaeon]|nr:MAG: hypothetical protein DRJ59_07425 [Thermoprotei archaeon]